MLTPAENAQAKSQIGAILDSLTQGAPSNPTATLTSSATTIQAGQSVTLTWASTNGVSATLNGAMASLGGSGAYSPTSNTTYTYTVTGQSGTTPATATASVTVVPAGDNPSTIGSGLIRWGRPESLSLADGAPFADQDFSGAGHVFTQSNAAFQPHYDAAAQAFRYDGVNDWVACDPLAPIIAPNPTQSFTYGVRFRHAAIDRNSNQTLFILASVTGNPPSTHDLFYRCQSNNYDSDHRNAAGDELSGMAGFTPDLAEHSLVLVFNGSTSKIWIDGVFDGEFDQNVGGAYAALDSFTYGTHRRVDGLTAPWNGWLGRDVVYGTALSDADAVRLSAYLGSAALPFDPLQLPGMNVVSWYRGDSLAPQTDGVGASLWYSRRIPEVQWASNGEINGSPVVRLTAQNDRAMLQLNGSTDYVAVPAGIHFYLFAGVNQPFAVFVACKGGVGTVWSLGNNGGTSTHTVTALRVVPTAYVFTRTDDAGSTKTISGGTPDANAHCVAVNFDGTTGTLYVDGVQVAAGDMSLGQCTINWQTIGARRYSMIDDYYAGDIGELVSLNRSLSGAELMSVFGYQRTFWGTP